MRWKGRRQSSNIEDRRGSSPGGFGGLSGLGRGGGGGLLRLLPLAFKFLGFKGTLIAVLGIGAYMVFSGGGLGGLLGGMPGTAVQTTQKESRGGSQPVEQSAHLLNALFFEDFRIHQRKRLAAILGGVDDDHPARIVDLDRGQTDTRCLVHGLEHVVDQAAHAIVDRRHRLGDVAQTRVGEVQNIEDRHIRTRVL